MLRLDFVSGGLQKAEMALSGCGGVGVVGVVIGVVGVVEEDGVEDEAWSEWLLWI